MKPHAARALKPLAALTLLAALVALLLYALSPAPPAAAQTGPNDYDTNDNNLIEISDLDQLNAIRHDPDGNGDPITANTSTYYAAFPNPVTTTNMGCRSTCTGYELMANLDFAADGMAVTTTDAYPNWPPILNYATRFHGNGHTIANLTINATATGAAGNAGLFGFLPANAIIRDLGLLTPDITGANYVGASPPAPTAPSKSPPAKSAAAASSAGTNAPSAPAPHPPRH